MTFERVPGRLAGGEIATFGSRFQAAFDDIIDIRLRKLSVTSMERKIKPRFDVESRLSKRDF